MIAKTLPGNNHQTSPIFLKWAGGKQWLADPLSNLISSHKGKYFEPFLGGGSLFFISKPQNACLADKNDQLIKTYQTVRDEVDQLIKVLRNWKYDSNQYYQIRKTRFRTKLKKAAQFIYLNRTCWNGLYRVNRKGEFNVPIGRFSNPQICNEVALKEASRLLKTASISIGDFGKTIRDAKYGDLIYFDPPYTVAHENNGFVKYNQKIFSWKDQRRLARTAKKLKDKGCRVIVSNAYHPSVLALYPTFNKYVLTRKSLLAGNSKKRRIVKEVLMSSFEVPISNMGKKRNQ